MKLRMNKKLSAVALSVATLAGGLGMSGTAAAIISGSATTNFTASVNVVSDNVCTFNVVQPSNETFQVTWTEVNGSTQFSNLTTSEPLGIRVSATGSGCFLNNLRVGLKVNGTSKPNAGQLGAAVPFGSAGGSWVIMPTVANAVYYTDANFTTVGTAAVTLTTALAQSTTIVRGVATADAGLSGQNEKPAMGPSATDTYYMTKLYTDTPLLANTSGDTVSAQFSQPELYRSAEFGVTALIGNAPVDNTGARNLKMAANGDIANMPFTVTVTQA